MSVGRGSPLWRTKRNRTGTEITWYLAALKHDADSLKRSVGTAVELENRCERMIEKEKVKNNVSESVGAKFPSEKAGILL